MPSTAPTHDKPQADRRRLVQMPGKGKENTRPSAQKRGLLLRVQAVSTRFILRGGRIVLPCRSVHFPHRPGLLVQVSKFGITYKEVNPCVNLWV